LLSQIKLKALLTVGLLLTSGGIANAATDSYQTVAGSFMQVSATRSDTGAVIFNDTLVFDAGASGGFVDFDPLGTPTLFATGTPAGTIEDFVFNLPASGPFSVTGFGEREEVYIDSGSIGPGAGFSTLINSFGSIQAGPIASVVTYSAFDTDGILPDILGATLDVSTPTPFGANVSFPSGNINLVLGGVVLGSFNGAAFGEGTVNPITGLSDVDVNITGTVNWTGELVIPVPEPTTALLLGAGLAWLSGRRRH
jgi:hypothetical protein